jgi:simple sugar transport system substrate-binding protein
MILHKPGTFFAIVFLFFLALPPGRAAEPKMKVAFIYVGPISDYGYTRAADDGRIEAQKELPWIDTTYVESVTDADVESYIDQMVEQGARVIFLTSTSFADGGFACASRYPNVIFFNASGYRTAPNLANYQADTYQCAYLEGLAAGAISKHGKIGSVSSYPTPEVVRIIDAFTLGMREVNPKAAINLLWLNSWYDPPATKEAAEALLAEGADFLISDMDSPTVAEVGETHHIPVTGPSAYTYRTAPTSLIASACYNWGPVYVSLLKGVKDGTYTATNLQNRSFWFRMGENATQLAYKPGVTINPRYKDALGAVHIQDGPGAPISVYDLMLKRIAQMSATPLQFEPFTGPIVDAGGKMRIPAGQTATKADLLSITWRLPEILGNWPTH